MGAAVSRIYPGLDERIFNRRRDEHVRRRVAEGGYATALADLTVPLHEASVRPPHLVVVPQEGPRVDSWRAGGGNFLYEIAQGARETFGSDAVSIFEVCGEQDESQWHQRLIRHLVETGATHLLAQVEADPNSGQGRYSWDLFWSQAVRHWDGVLLGLVTDSYFTWITNSVRRLARMSPRFVLVDICMPMDSVLVKGRPEVGPVNMPISDESLSVIDIECRDAERVYDVTFIGTLYPSRVSMLESIEATGARVAVNPHRSSPAPAYGSEDVKQPSYVDYMRALAQSRITINFSQANAGPQQQLKTRILESMAMGCLVLTDDIDRTARFWAPGEEYGRFHSLDDLPKVIEAWLADPERLDQVREAGQRRARSINVSSFWGGIEDTLTRRGLPGLRPLD